MWQLAYEIDREADDQNEYLDGMVRKDSDIKCIFVCFLTVIIQIFGLVYSTLPSCSVHCFFSLLCFSFQDSNFLSATGLLSGSVKRFSTMVRSGRDNRRILCYVSVGLVLVFFLLYYLVSRIQRWQENGPECGPDGNSDCLISHLMIISCTGRNFLLCANVRKPTGSRKKGSLDCSLPVWAGLEGTWWRLSIYFKGFYPRCSFGPIMLQSGSPKATRQSLNAD